MTEQVVRIVREGASVFGLVPNTNQRTMKNTPEVNLWSARFEANNGFTFDAEPLARLFAAAPALLEAAKAAVARQVINNWATAGEWVCRNCGEMPSEHAHDEGCWVALCNAAIAAAEGVE